jgi:predicted transcriptional regulator
VTEQTPNTEALAQTSTIVAAYVAKNSVPADQIPNLISTVYASLTGLGNSTAVAVVEAARPAVPIRKSITPEYLVCLEDGKKLKMLKRHLSSTYGMTPEDYRAKWGLAHDYPMTAPNYSEQRSTLAKSLGLGTQARRQPAPVKPARGQRRRPAAEQAPAAQV